jgi:type IV secretion system protein VirD4
MRREYPIWLGYRDRTCSTPLWFPGSSGAHGFLCAPTRSGKFRDLLVQILTTFEGSILSIDPKGQACAVTARYRKQTLGQKVYRLDPFNLLPSLPGIKYCPPVAQIDPMASLDPRSDRFGADADNIAESCVTPDGRGDDHWINAAGGLISGVIMAVKTRWPKESLPYVYRIISGSNLFAFARDACSYAALNQIGDFTVERLARYTPPGASENKELLSIVSTATTNLRFIGNKCTAESLNGSTFRFESMKLEPITCYLILPGEYLGGNVMKWFRLIAGTFVGRLHAGTV